jgi:hypothetical protein
MHHKDEQKMAQKCSYLVSMNMIQIYMFFKLTMTRVRESKTLILPPTLGHCHLFLWLHLPKFCMCCLSLALKWSLCCKYSSWIESFKVQTLQICSMLVAIVSDFGFGGLHLASLVFIAHDLFGHNLPSPPSWL